ncbi:MAG: hypothetical protein HY764_02690 [Candidatus Portnoybacteria bacterium]|nr:hypothetical protein [Candidatus Portnoybacteria bacterium]
MEQALIAIIIIFVIFSIAPTRYKIREIMMKNLAKDFNLNFSSNPPKFSDFYFKFLILRPDWDVNHIEGAVKGRDIHIYDNLFSGPKIILTAFNYSKRHTVIRINGQSITGKEEQYKSFKFQDSCLTSINELRGLLKSFL